MFDNTVTRNRFGQVNHIDSALFSDLPVQDETKLHIYIEEYDNYSGPVTATTTNGYVLSGTGATTAFAGIDGGGLNLIGATTGFIAALQRAQGSFKLVTGLRTWFRALCQISTLASATQLIAGLTNVTTTPFTAISDGIWFSSDAVGAGALSINVAVGSVVTTVAIGSNLVAAAMADLKWYWDAGIYAAAPNGRIVYEVSGAGVTANVRGEVAAPANFPGATLLAPQMAVKGTAGTPTLSIDLVNAMKERDSVLATPVF